MSDLRDPENSQGFERVTDLDDDFYQPIVKTNFKVDETRYLEANIGNLLSELRGRPIFTSMEYDVTTIYLDFPERTWSVGKSDPKFRLRNYNQENMWWLEKKHRVDGVTSKQRVPMEDPESFEPLEPLVIVHYNRVSFESHTLRITIDFNVSVYDLTQELLGTLAFPVVEIKADKKIPDWLELLLGSQDHIFSKSKWALGTEQIAQDRWLNEVTNEIVTKSSKPISTIDKSKNTKK